MIPSLYWQGLCFLGYLVQLKAFTTLALGIQEFGSAIWTITSWMLIDTLVLVAQLVQPPHAQTV